MHCLILVLVSHSTVIYFTFSPYTDLIISMPSTHAHTHSLPLAHTVVLSLVDEEEDERTLTCAAFFISERCEGIRGDVQGPTEPSSFIPLMLLRFCCRRQINSTFVSLLLYLRVCVCAYGFKRIQCLLCVADFV